MNITGTPGNDNGIDFPALVGTSGNDAIQGLAGDDKLLGLAGNDNLNGDDGNDTLDGGDGHDYLYGAGGTNTLIGSKGNDVLDGWYSIFGGVGSDDNTMQGGKGNDLYYVDNASTDKVIEKPNEGTDTVVTAVDYTLGANVENLVLSLVNGIKGTGNELANRMSTEINNGTLDGAGGNDILIGAWGSDTLIGSTGNDTLSGDAGNDALIGGAGIDTLIETGDVVRLDLTDTSLNGLGTDTLNGIEKAQLTGGSSANTIDASNFTGSVTLRGEAGNDELIGGAGNDLLDGGEDDDAVFGGSGNDVLYGGLGMDNMNGQEGDDKVFGDDGDDNIGGGVGNDQVTGGNGNDFLAGEEGKDQLTGGNGDDTLVGGFGSDTLTGGSGKDTFRFDAKNEGIDTIKDFKVVDDTIRVSANGFSGGLTPGAAITVDQFRLGSSAQDASDRFIYNKSNGALFFDVDGKGGIGQVQIAQFSTGLNLTNNDIFVG